MTDNSEQPDELAGTIGGRYAETHMFEPDDSCSRQEQDIAFAAALLQSGVVNERELSAAVFDWSMHGSIALADHLLVKRILTEDQIAAIQQSATSRVLRARRSIAGGSEMPATARSMLLATLERLDGSGRVAKLFGVTIAGCGGDDDTRVMEGRYELIRKLGQGGLGRVWSARDVNLNRYVALKEISHTSSDASALVERFKHEAEITGRLDHPSIVPIYQLGNDKATGRIFYTMRFLGRQTLQDAISEYHERRGEGDDDPMLHRNLLSAFVNVCHAIGHAHSRKVIHRDLKPENVVIDNFGQVIVIDWGLAKVINETSVESFVDSGPVGSADRTSEGQILGTPLYMAPEQAAGRLDELDHRTDIYGLGAILFAIVSGCAPHEKTQKESADKGAGSRGMISVIVSGETPRARDVNADVDPRLAAVCSKAMARRRYARYQSAASLAEDVQRWMAGELVTAYQESKWQRLGRWVSQHPRVSQTLIGAAMVILVALTTFGMSARYSRLAALNAQFAAIQSDVREVESQLRSVVSDLQKDVRFVATLSSIQGVIDARGEVVDEGEDVWRDRLEASFAGLLRSNTEYLAISLESGSEGNASDIVRVERNPTDPSLLRVQPKSRLLTVKADTLMSKAAKLQPDDVKLSLDRRDRYASSLVDQNRLSVATPIFDENSGEFFGMIVIETDYVGRIMEVMLGLGFADSEFFVADGLGNLLVWSDTESGVQLATPGQSIPDLPATVASLLNRRGESFRLSSQNEYVAVRYYLDPEGRGVMILARPAEG